MSNSIDSLAALKTLDVEKVAAAIEADAGVSFEGDLRESLRQAVAGEFAAVHTPEQIAARKRGRPVGAVAATRKTATTIRLDTDLLATLKAAGRGWQTRVNAALREAVEAGRV